MRRPPTGSRQKRARTCPFARSHCESSVAKRIGRVSVELSNRRILMKMRDLPSWSQTHFDYFMDAVRIYLGIGLLIKGISFATNPNYFASTFNGFAFDRLLPIVPYVHIFAGIFLAAGIFTRVAAIVQIPILFA